MNLAQKIGLKYASKTIKDFPTFKAGDSVSVSVKVKEGEKERVQIFKGTVMKIQGSAASRTFTVRKMSNGVGVERTWPFSSPAIDKVDVHAIGKVRRSKIFYLRKLRGRAAVIESKLVTQKKTTKKKKKSKKEAAASTPA